MSQDIHFVIEQSIRYLSNAIPIISIIVSVAAFAIGATTVVALKKEIKHKKELERIRIDIYKLSKPIMIDNYINLKDDNVIKEHDCIDCLKRFSK